MVKQTQLIVFLFTVLFSIQSMALGSRTPKRVSAEAFDTDYTVRVPIAKADGHNFDRRFKIDFNNDGVMDRLHCDSANLRVFVRDGKKLNQDLFMWNGPAVRELGDKSKRIFTGCEVIELKKGLPSIVVSTAYVHPVNGVRVRSEQFFIHNKGNKRTVQHVHAIKNGQSILYKAASRSVKCTEFPQKLVKLGYKPGALCFYAGYDSDTPVGYGTMAALIKFEENGAGDLVAKDLTGSSGLPWHGGVGGTSKGVFPTYKNGNGDTKRDGLHMMGSAFLDTNNDGLSDMITVGQHASIRLSKMVIDRSKPEGVRFDTSNILKAAYGNMTEFLSIQAINEFDSRLGRKCLYITGENNDGRSTGAAVHDHFRCLEGGQWKRHDLPIVNFSSEYRGAAIRRLPDGKIYIKVTREQLVDGKTVPTGDFLFQIVQ